ncbi:MAG: tRNA (adenosine(37)-N6)-threonylcarbamoyltransferase complex ATPase subunit type 1 TsaE [Prolixibacteraceae bacterium]
MKTLYLRSLEELERVAEEFIRLINNHKVLAFYGEMGAGKTTFIKTVCRMLGVTENITSPTFSIVNEYIAKENKLIYHFDCYRLKNLKEAYDIGAEEYLYSGNLCFIEWPEIIEDLLPDHTLKINLKVLANQQREIILHV